MGDIISFTFFKTENYNSNSPIKDVLSVHINYALLTYLHSHEHKTATEI